MLIWACCVLQQLTSKVGCELIQRRAKSSKRVAAVTFCHGGPWRLITRVEGCGRRFPVGNWNLGVTLCTSLPADARHVLIGINTRAGGADRQAIVGELCRLLVSRGFECCVHWEIDALASEAERLLATGQLRAVVAAGGDGTFRLIAQRTPVGTPLVVLPLGTENLLARYLEMTADPAALADIIAEGLTVALDAGQAGERLFTLMAGCGFDADVVRRLHQARSGHIHHLSYAKPILDSIRTYDYPELRVYCAPAKGGEGAALTHAITARWVFVINLPRYAGGLSFAPQASGFDGLLDVCTFKEGSLWYGLMYLGGVMLGQHEAMKDFLRVQTRRVRVEAAGAVPFQLDGDPGGELPIEIRVEPGRLKVLVSRAWAQRQRIASDDAE
jgi:diacylglycerol kinase family enzyme